ncbi:hypothetical protein AQ490_10090 [Wenjunlia vitaminophila]|uniref:Integral membrane protein n=1 Tax=Wenjunlia vitaminophila TaxID=76728 RepID=A0A0T6LM77_WENVI|nr:hypothetical protein [Wenjunlia vitaminophila]KRV47093.1 hypothetical protein AQ490_10090 [Wenjunlia vitaminophila]
MLLETLGFALVGVAAAYGAIRLLPRRLPSLLLVATTGLIAALVGGWVTRSVVGPGNQVVTVPVAAAVSVALITVLISPKPRPRHAASRHA